MPSSKTTTFQVFAMVVHNFQVTKLVLAICYCIKNYLKFISLTKQTLSHILSEGQESGAA